MYFEEDNRLCRPDSLHELGKAWKITTIRKKRGIVTGDTLGPGARTDVVGVELIHPYECTGSREPEDPGEERAQDGELALMQVVGERRVKLSQYESQQTGTVSTPIRKKRRAVGCPARAVRCRSLTPMCEWTTRLSARTPSRTACGLALVAAAAPITGIRLALRSRSNAQWCEPCARDGSGNSVGSLIVPL